MHSLIPMSSASVWSVCTAQPSLNAMCPPEQETPESMEGTATHELGCTFVELLTRALPYPARETVVSTLASNGIVFDETMYECAKIYADHCGEVMRKTGNFNPMLEKTLAAKSIHAESFGTFDFGLFDKANGVIYVRDYKHGFLPVEVFENTQLIGYVCAIAESLGIDGHNDQMIDVDMGIVQPRAHHRHGPIRTWKVKLSTLRGYFNKLHNAANEVFSTNAKTVTGNHCLYCNARAICPTLQKAAQAVVEFTGGSLPVELKPESLGVELAILEKAENLLTARITGLRSQAETLIKQGKNVSNYQLSNVVGRLKWNIPDGQVLVMGQLYGKNLKKESVITPTQAIDLGMPKDAVETIAAKSTSVKLTFNDGTDARYFFSKEV